VTEVGIKVFEDVDWNEQQAETAGLETDNACFL
jgi:hypothetical protein